jgi:hypothetical protein
MIVIDAPWRSQWIRGALQDYEYRGKCLMPPESERQNIPAIRRKLEDLVLRELYERQVDMHGSAKQNKRTITAADLYKPNKRLLNAYGRNHWEVPLQRGECKLFENTESGRAALDTYCSESGINPSIFSTSVTPSNKAPAVPQGFSRGRLFRAGLAGINWVPEAFWQSHTSARRASARY